MKIEWPAPIPAMSSCPACGTTGLNAVFVCVHSPQLPEPVEYTSCGVCGSLFVARFKIPQYETSAGTLSGNEAAVRYYIELGAGLETLALPAACASSRDVKHYLEVGSGFGFGLDFARHAFGWAVKGIDPGSLAKVGRRMLGLDIESRYLGSDERLPVKYDAVAAIEVIEHITGPREFIVTLRNALDPAGLIFLTTPNADYIEQGMDKPGVIAALSAGFHAVLFSQKALQALLQNAGFPEARVETRGASLFAIAGPGAHGIDIAAQAAGPAFSNYLEARSEDPALPVTLQIGFNYRLFKFLVNSNRLAEAGAAFRRLEALILKRDGLRISGPLEILNRMMQPMRAGQLLRTFPNALPCIYFFEGIRYLNTDGNALRASTYFYAAYLMALLVNQELLKLGIDDGEINDIAVQARRHLAMVMDAQAPWQLDVARLG